MSNFYINVNREVDVTPIAEIPYGAYWSTPFARWQGSLATAHSLELAAETARRETARRGIDVRDFDFGVLGMTVPQRGSFYGLPWLMGLLGAEEAAGPTISQACATGARALAVGCEEVAGGRSGMALVITADRVSNGPHIFYPQPNAQGGAGDYENWILDNFARDPFAGCAMIETAENVAARFDISMAEQHDFVQIRYEQYQAALKDDHAFQKRYMTLPFEVPASGRRKQPVVLTGDEGIYPTTPEKLAGLSPPWSTAERSASRPRRTPPTATRRSSSHRRNGRSSCRQIPASGSAPSPSARAERRRASCRPLRSRRRTPP